MKDKMILVCSECLSRNYSVNKSKANHVNRLEIKKFCRRCNKHTIHKETK